jgi:hypothetical protein
MQSPGRGRLDTILPDASRSEESQSVMRMVPPRLGFAEHLPVPGRLVCSPAHRLHDRRLHHHAASDTNPNRARCASTNAASMPAPTGTSSAVSLPS